MWGGLGSSCFFLQLGSFQIWLNMIRKYIEKETKNLQDVRNHDILWSSFQFCIHVLVIEHWSLEKHCRRITCREKKNVHLAQSRMMCRAAWKKKFLQETSGRQRLQGKLSPLHYPTLFLCPHISIHLWETLLLDLKTFMPGHSLQCAPDAKHWFFAFVCLLCLLLIEQIPGESLLQNVLLHGFFPEILQQQAQAPTNAHVGHLPVASSNLDKSSLNHHQVLLEWKNGPIDQYWSWTY